MLDFSFPISEYQSWDPFTEGQINALDRAQTEAAQLINITKDTDGKLGSA
jgi:hypothetical protein